MVMGQNMGQLGDGLLVDNHAVIHIVNSLTFRFQRVMDLARALTLHCLQFSIVFHSRHVPGVDNTLADDLSSQQINLFRVLTPGARLNWKSSQMRYGILEGRGQQSHEPTVFCCSMHIPPPPILAGGRAAPVDHLVQFCVQLHQKL